MDKGAWWATVYGVTKSQTLLKRLNTLGAWGYLRSFLVILRDFLIAQLVKNLLAMQETPLRFLDWEDLLEKG